MSTPTATTSTASKSTPWWEEVLRAAGDEFAGNNPGVGVHASAAVQNAVTQNVPGASTAQAVVDTIASPQWWQRIGIGAAGVGLIIFGIITILATTSPGRAVVGTAAKAAVLA